MVSDLGEQAGTRTGGQRWHGRTSRQVTTWDCTQFRLTGRRLARPLGAVDRG